MVSVFLKRVISLVDFYIMRGKEIPPKRLDEYIKQCTFDYEFEQAVGIEKITDLK